LTNSSEDARIVAQRIEKLRAQGRAGGLIDSVRSADNWLPPQQEKSIAEASRLRAALTPRLRAELSEGNRQLLDRALSDASLRPLKPADLPDALSIGLREIDGSFGKNVLIFPKLDGSTWNAAKL